jgi:hypothetical protein
MEAARLTSPLADGQHFEAMAARLPFGLRPIAAARLRAPRATAGKGRCLAEGGALGGGAGALPARAVLRILHASVVHVGRKYPLLCELSASLALAVLAKCRFLTS